MKCSHCWQSLPWWAEAPCGPLLGLRLLVGCWRVARGPDVGAGRGMPHACWNRTPCLLPAASLPLRPPVWVGRAKKKKKKKTLQGTHWPSQAGRAHPGGGRGQAQTGRVLEILLLISFSSLFSSFSHLSHWNPYLLSCVSQKLVIIFYFSLSLSLTLNLEYISK